MVRTQTAFFFDLNYAVEIFNPTQTTISLANYTLELTDPLQNTISIPLNGSIAPWGTHIVCNDNADLNLQGLADELSSGLDFELYMMLDLKNNGVVIDRVGQGGTATNNTFDVYAFILDPVGYLANLHVDLNDFETINLRRGITVTKGEPNFSTPIDLKDNWAFYPNIDRSNLGQHLCRCNYDVLLANNPGVEEILEFGYTLGNSTLNCSGNSNVITNINLEANQNSVNTTVTTISYEHTKITTIGGATFGTPTDNLYFTSCSPNLSCITTSGGFTTLPMLGVNVSGNQGTGNFVGIRPAVFELTNVTSSNSIFLPVIDNLNNFHTIDYIGCVGTNVSNINKPNAFKIYPNPASGDVIINSNSGYDYSIYNCMGQIIKKGVLIEGDNIISTSNLSNALYSIQITDIKTGQFISKRLSIKN